VNKQATWWGGFITGVGSVVILSSLLYVGFSEPARCEQKTWTQGRTYVTCSDGANAEMNRMIEDLEREHCGWEMLPRTARAQYNSFIMECQ